MKEPSSSSAQPSLDIPSLEKFPHHKLHDSFKRYNLKKARKQTVESRYRPPKKPYNPKLRLLEAANGSKEPEIQ